MKNTAVTVRQAKATGAKITMLTAYDYSIARLADAAGVNTILVGDSLGMCMLGYADTIPVTMDEMLHHTKAVARGVESALIVGDLPFMSYQASVYDAVVNAGRLIKEGGAGCIKLEGGAVVAPQIRAIVEAGIPVMGHIGLTPQSVNALGGFKVQGKDAGAAKKLIDDALAIQEAGAFSIVLECMPGGLGALLTSILDIPTIGIGAGLDCDGQAQIYQDAVNLYGGKPPKHAKVFADAGGAITTAFETFIAQVGDGSFPTEEQTFKTDEEMLAAAKAYAAEVAGK